MTSCVQRLCIKRAGSCVLSKIERYQIDKGGIRPLQVLLCEPNILECSSLATEINQKPKNQPDSVGIAEMFIPGGGYPLEVLIDPQERRLQKPPPRASEETIARIEQMADQIVLMK